MRKYKQVKEKKITYPINEWHEIERRAAALSMKTGTYIRHMSVNGQITYYNVKDIAPVINALRIIGGNINQIARKANEINSIYAGDIENIKENYEQICHTLKSISIHTTVNRSLAYTLNPINHINIYIIPKLCIYMSVKEISKK